MSTTNTSALNATNISKFHDEFCVLRNINLSIQRGEKVGLVGPNGIGKTTLLKILAGFESSDEGRVDVLKHKTIGYIPQEFREFYTLTAGEFLSTNTSDVSSAAESLAALAKLGLNETFLSRSMSDLSGGEKTKIALARILSANQDILLLDEPTNNLDFETLDILEKFIQNSDKTFLIISHDREFLNKTVSRIFEIDEFERTVHVYDGNFTSYLDERRRRLERQWSQYDDSVEKKERLEDVIAEKINRADAMDDIPDRDNDKSLRNFKIEHGKKAIHQRAKSLQNRLDRMGDIEKPKTPLPPKLEFEIDERGGDKVFELQSVVKKQGLGFTLGPIELSVQYGDRILITGKNGSGKTTLLNVMLSSGQQYVGVGNLGAGNVGANNIGASIATVPDSGRIVSGTKLVIGYLPQQEDFLPDNTVRDEFLRHVEIEEGLARRTLHRFGLSADDVKKKIQNLSSGERSRLILAIMMGRRPNCLILDEPSNHLDFEILESLESALADFTGTLIVVSHDRYFINRLNVDTTFILEDGLLRLVSRVD